MFFNTWTKSSLWAWVKQSHLVFGYGIFQSLEAGVLDLISLYIYIFMRSIFPYWEYILRIPLLVFTIQRLMIDIDNTDTSYFSVSIHEHLFLCSGADNKSDYVYTHVLLYLQSEIVNVIFLHRKLAQLYSLK